MKRPELRQGAKKPIVAWCEDYARGFDTLEQAERWAETVACPLEHHVEAR